MPCAGNPSATCGGSNALSLVYDTTKLNADLSPKSGASTGSGSSSGSTGGSTGGSSGSNTGSSSTGPNIGAFTLANGFSTDGACTAEIPGRLLTGAAFDSPKMTYTLCTDFCASNGFAYAGVEYGSGMSLSCSRSSLSSRPD
jgi:hypothetical protein